MKVDGYKYYSDVVPGYGVAAQNSCPWYAWLTGATLYDVKLNNSNRFPITNYLYKDYSKAKYTTIKYSDELKSGLEALVIKFDVVGSGSEKVIEIPIVPVTHYVGSTFDFYYGSTGIFGGCPQLNYHHSATVNGTIYYSMIG